ncbi:MAG: sensor histidine kinase [Anaerolineales bacterium]|nr:sensor histidine kinase [Anaerolineales bacterium]
MTEKINRSQADGPIHEQTEVQAGRESWLFLLVVSAVLVGLYVYALYLNPALREPPELLVLSGLMLLHMGLYWGMLWLPPYQNRSWIIYLAVQTLLATAIVLYTRNPAVVFGLYAPLIGLSVGVFRDRRLAAGAVVICLGLIAAAMVTLEGTESLVDSAIFIIPMVVFVIIYVVLFNRQVEARAQATALLEELEVAHQELASYAAQVEDLTVAAERQRMARELHDTLAQGLAGLILQLEAADAHLEQGRADRAREIVGQAMSRARATLVDARRAIDDLRRGPGVSTDLEEGIRVEAERFSRSTGIHCDLEIAIQSQVPELVGEHAQRIVAEALTNIARHAEADRVWVSAGDREGRLEIEVRDDGKGFAKEAGSTASGHYGVIGMRERARLAGGTMAIQSRTGEGTSIEVSLPLAQEVPEPDAA